MLNFNDIKLEDFMDNSLKNKDLDKSDDDIAIIGMAGVFPLADNVQSFWENIRLGTDCVHAIPNLRKEQADKYLHHVNILNTNEYRYKKMGYIDQIDNFDYKFFNLSPKEASLMDPKQRLFLQVAYQAIEHAGYGGKRLNGTETGVFVGHSELGGISYREMIQNIEPDSYMTGFIGNLPSVIPSRISYLLDLNGPSMLIDTSCSSSLTSLYLACQAIKNGDCKQAIVGTAHINLLPFEIEQKLGIEASDYRTRSFDDGAEGTGSGEGVIAILIKPLNCAIEDGDHIEAVIKGGAINQDGNSIALTAPNVEAQEKVICQAWENAGVSPEDITYIEAHATGTSLGDPIEIAGLEKAFERFTERKQFCAIGSVKSNLGHLEAAAGLAGVVKSVMAMKMKELPPSIHFYRPNRKIEFESSPVFVNDLLLPWENGGKARVCGVSSFGMSGTNCHIVLSEWNNENSVNNHQYNNMFHLLTISAKSEKAVKELIKKYQKLLNENQYDLRDLCYTANTGRGHYNYRLAIIFQSEEELKTKLNLLVTEENLKNQKKQGVFWGEYSLINRRTDENIKVLSELNIKKSSQEALRYINQIENPYYVKGNELQNICEYYIEGADIDWDFLYKGELRKKVILPVYVFDKYPCLLSIPEKNDSKEFNLNISHLLKDSKVPADLKKEIENLTMKWDSYISINNSVEDILSEIKIVGKDKQNYSKNELLVAKVWAEELGLKTIHIIDNFFELGGDSIIALKVINKLNRYLSLEWKVTDLLKYPIFKDLISHIDKDASEKVTKLKNDIELSKVMDYYPISSAQKRIYIMEQFTSGTTTYNMPQAFILEGNLNLEKVKQSFLDLMEKQESLRTSFQLINGQPVQKIHASLPFEVEEIKIKENINTTIRNFIRPFNLQEPPLFRVGIGEIEENKYLLLLDIHHIIADGTSMAIFTNEFIKAYSGQEIYKPNRQYKDFTNWKENMVNSHEYQKQEEFYKRIFSGEIPILNLPTDFSRSDRLTYSGEKFICYSSKELESKLRKLALTAETTLFTVLLSAYYLLMYKYTLQKDIVVGTLINGRPHYYLENVIGMFVDTIPIRTSIQTNQSFFDFMRNTKKNVMEFFDNSNYPFEKIVENIKVKREAARNPLFDTMFVLQNMEKPNFDLEGVSLEKYPFENNTSMFDITLFASEQAQGIEFTFEFSTQLFKRETIKMMSEHYLKILDDITSNPEIQINDILREKPTQINLNVENIEFQF
ncbi:polyketide synthase [Bacillus thuringiensis]|uniref:condensation domain-containing protein n=1 Tax=Bacillus thuringiensis TaxID=1428 RepID=UPI000BFCC20D|nr:condensation domain-containing protein [Bacillus thuringiensis]PGW17698.1 polyketide synthase [Bacillus thuringiensis]